MWCLACDAEVGPDHDTQWSCGDAGCGRWFHGTRCPACGWTLDPRLAPDGRVRHTALPARAEQWRRHTVSGAVLTGVALGLREALGVPVEQAAVVWEASGEPPGRPDWFDAELDPDHPERSRLVVRPWLLEE